VGCWWGGFCPGFHWGVFFGDLLGGTKGGGGVGFGFFVFFLGGGLRLGVKNAGFFGCVVQKNNCFPLPPSLAFVFCFLVGPKTKQRTPFFFGFSRLGGFWIFFHFCPFLECLGAPKHKKKKNVGHPPPPLFFWFFLGFFLNTFLGVPCFCHLDPAHPPFPLFGEKGKFFFFFLSFPLVWGKIFKVWVFFVCHCSFFFFFHRPHHQTTWAKPPFFFFSVPTRFFFF